MKPISPIVPGLEEHEIRIAEDQPEYETLPVLKLAEGVIITRWRLTLRERLVALFNGDIYLWIHTFGKPLQPIRLDVDEPRLVIIRVPEPEVPNA